MNIGEKFYCSRCLRTLEDEMICPYCGYDPSSEADPSVLEENVLLNDGRYLIGAVIGTGGFGITYAAWDLEMNGPVAIKEYYPSSICRRDARRDDRVIVSEEDLRVFEAGLLRFKLESDVLVNLRNVKNVVSVYHWFEANNTAYIVMEYVRGVPLDAYVREHNLTCSQVFNLLKDLIDSMILVHNARITHRDINPKNILIREDGTATLIDFGAAIIEERIAEGKGKTVFYTRHFAPPEQYDEQGLQGPWTDVYGLSATIYYVITGELAQDNSTSRKNKTALRDVHPQNGRLKKYEKKAILDGLIADPEKRIHNMELFRSVLYNLPLPEEIQKHRAMMAKFLTLFSAVFIVVMIFIMNFTTGLPLGNSVRGGLHSDGFHITGFHGKDSQFTIPGSIAGIPMISIERGAFSSSQLQSVQIPGSIKEIGANAFNGCQNLETVTIDEGCVRLESLAFSGCPKLNTVFLPKSLTFIGKNVFSDSTGSLTVWCDPDSVCRETLSQENINTASESSYITSETNNGIAINGYVAEAPEDGKLKTLILPDYINGIPVTDISGPSSVFDNIYTSIKLPDHIIVLRMGVVRELTRLDTLILGSDLEEIDSFALSECGIKSIELPGSLVKIGIGAFFHSALTSLTLPDSVSKVGMSAFAAMYQLESVYLSSEMTEIPEEAFEGCTALISVAFRGESKITKIGKRGFSNCRSLETIKLPTGVEEIGKYAFLDCAHLKIIDIPDTVTIIDPTAFDGCPNDMLIVGSAGSEAESFAAENDYRFLNLAQYDYYNYRVTSNNSVLIWDGVTEEQTTYLPAAYSGSYYSIAENIVDATNLKSHVVYLPICLKRIGRKSFARNRYLEEVNGYENVKLVEEFAFWDCPYLKTVNISSQIESINEYAFAEDVSLREFTLPDSLTFLGDYAFWKCAEIKSVNIPPGITQLYDGCFAETGITDVVIPGTVVKCRTAFYGCNDLTRVSIEEGTRSLLGTFADCRNLETVVIPSTMERISRSTFRACTSLKDIWIYSDNVDLDYMCSSLQYVASFALKKTGYRTLTVDELEANEQKASFLFADSPDVTIHAHAGSSAQVFAQQHGLSFKLIE